MAVVPGFKYDLFISYAHRNDVPWGWVTDFVQTLKAELESKSRDIRIWWDPGLRTGEDFNVAIANAISESATFLSVLSPAYGDSTYCRKEIEEFRQQRHPAFGIMVGSMSRMQAMVIDREYTRDKWAPEFRNTSPQEFYDERSSLFGRPATLVSSDPWIKGLWNVRDSLWAVITEMRNRKQSGAVMERNYGARPAAASDRPTLFLAEVTDDMYRKREKLRSALEQGGTFDVSTWAEASAPAAADPATLTAHLFGAFPGRGFGDSEKSLPQLQLEEVLKSQPSRRPVVWLPRNLDLDDVDADDHRAFLEMLLASSAIELLRCDFEDLKDELAKRMVVNKPPAKQLRGQKDGPIIHIWHTMDNPNSLAPLKTYLSENNCGISTFDCRTAQPEKMQSRLAVCDGLIVPYTPETRTWAEDVMTEAFRLRRREERPTAFAAVELPPATDFEFNFEHPRVVPVFVNQPNAYGKVGDFLARLDEADA